LPPRSSTHFEATLGPSIAFGLLPSASVGGFIRGGIVGEVWSIKLGASLFSPSRAVFGEVTARIWAFSTELTGCFAPIHGRVRWDLCAEMGGGANEASPSGLTGAIDQQLPFGFVGGATELAVRLSGLVWANIRASGWGMFMRPEYFFHGPDGMSHVLFQTWPIVPILSLGLSIRSGS
jgi:hypothetical protein